MDIKIQQLEVIQQKIIKSGINNTAVGYRSLRNITTGNRNIGLGGFSGAKNKVGNNNI